MLYQRNEIDFERTGRTVTVPNNDVARLMYYLNCVCVSIDINNDPDIQRFTNYRNYDYLSVEEQRALVVVCNAFSPDILDGKVFFHSDALCEDSSNEFYTISQVRSQLLAHESIIIAGQTRHVNKIMTYKLSWMKTYYFEPMERLVRRLSNAIRSNNSGSTYNTNNVQSIPYYTTPTQPIIYTNDNQSSFSSGRIVCVIVCIVIVISAIVGIIEAILRFFG